MCLGKQVGKSDVCIVRPELQKEKKTLEGPAPAELPCAFQTDSLKFHMNRAQQALLNSYFPLLIRNQKHITYARNAAVKQST